MGTRAIISFVEPSGQTVKKLWHQDSGNPDGIGRDLQILVDNLNEGWSWGYYGDGIIDLADWIQYRGLPTRGGVDHNYHEIGLDEEWAGVEYYYSLGTNGTNWFLYCTDSRGNILPLKRHNPDVPESKRLYEVRTIVGHEEFQSMEPFDQNLAYGDYTVFHKGPLSTRATRLYDKKAKRSWIKPGSLADKWFSKAKKKD